MNSVESPEWTYEDGDALAKEPIGTTSSRKPSANPAEPIKKTRLFSLAGSPKPIAAPAVSRSGSTQLDFTASSSPSSQNLNTSKSFFEPDYPSQRFRPEAYEKQDPADPYYSPPSTFIPPESPNDMKVQDHTSLAVLPPEAQTMTSSNQQYKGPKLAPTPVSDHQYTGLTLDRKQCGSLTSHGAFVPSSAPPRDTYNRGDIQAAEPLAILRNARGSSTLGHHHDGPSFNKMGRNISTHAGTNDSPFSSDAEIHPSSGVPLNQSDNTMPTTTLPQNANFPQLAEHQGIHDWNNSVFDDRWLLQPEEIWNLEARRESVVTVSPERPALTRNTSYTGDQMGSRIEGSQRSSTQNASMQRLIREVGEKKMELRGHQVSTAPFGTHWGENNDVLATSGRLATGRKLAAGGKLAAPKGNHTNQLVPTPPELDRLRKCVHELEAGSGELPSGLQSRPDIIRSFFYERVFGPIGPPAPLSASEAQNITEVGGRFVSLGALREQVVRDIEDLVQYMLSPVGEGIRSETSARTPTSTNELAFSDQLAAVESRNSNRSRLLSLRGDSSTIDMPIDRRRNANLPSTTGDGAQRKTPAQFLCNTGQTHPQLQETITASHPYNTGQQGTSGFGQGGIMPSGPPQGAYAEAGVGPGRAPTFAYGVPPQHQFGGYPGPFVVERGEYPSQMQYPQAFGRQQPSYTAPQPITYGNVWQQTYGQPTSAYPTYGQQTAMDRPEYLPPPLPNNRSYARPPATNRIAPLYAQTTAFHIPAAAQARQLPSAIRQISEWQNRFGLQPTVKPDLPSLPYRAGSDAMFPHAFGGASVRFQNLTRDVPHSLGTVSAEENVPFIETARSTKPAEWGVLKVGNIPYDLTKAQVMAFLGPHAKVITPDVGPAIHIIMDRPTGKTMDCYVEFFSTPDARAASNSLNLRPRHMVRINDRVVDVATSCQAELLKELFPKAKNVSWEGGMPKIQEAKEMYNTGFKTFVSAEEMGLLVRHAEQPHRSNFTQRSPQRTYEAMISLLAKFPWYATKHYSLATRNQIFAATRSMLHILSINLSKSYNSSTGVFDDYSSTSSYDSPVKRSVPKFRGSPHITEDLLKDLFSAALNAAGFSERQRWELSEATDCARHHFRISPLSQWWPFEVLGRKPHLDEDVVEFYADVIANNPVTRPDKGPFGGIAHITENIDLEANTMDAIGDLEWKLLYALIPGGLTGELGDDLQDAMGGRL